MCTHGSGLGLYCFLRVTCMLGKGGGGCVLGISLLTTSTSLLYYSCLKYEAVGRLHHASEARLLYEEKKFNDPNIHRIRNST